MRPRLVFVYNANAGLLAAAMDSLHKTLSPSTYSCDLCALTYGAFAMRPQWRNYLRQLPFEADFYHRPDFHAAFPDYANEPLPLVGMIENDTITTLLDAKMLSQLTDLEMLMSAMQARLEQR